ncbi:hypothetical protein CLIB1423_27S01222 [[Candida] railenensis]|uniref:BRCT domain-containing protein n=1 Tax=[Candida] railenensis TaxID=45579 RepID=A0A9P0QUZ8_9ASCO|nr:hypothetical protein CLIB1423_27S01222 [[Candida] railenensis]
MFQGSTFLIIKSHSDFADVAKTDHNRSLDSLATVLQENDANVLVKEDHANNVNYLESGDNDTEIPTHIISYTTQFIEYSLALTCMIPVTTPEWVWDSLDQGRLLNPKNYNPDSKYFLKDVFVCVADNLPSGDKEIIYGGVRAFGGQYLDDLTRYTTHLIAMDMSNDKSVIAASAVGEINIKIVKPEWIDECLKMGKKVHEGPYLLAGSEDSNGNINGAEDEGAGSLLFSSPLTSSFQSSFLESKTFYISNDCNISPRLLDTISSIIVSNGGSIATIFNTDTVDVYIGNYRSGVEFVESSKSNRIIVGTLQWLYSIIISGKWVLPLNSNLLHYPVPLNKLSDFSKLKICITNYTGEARFYLSKLITIMGGEFTKTLTRDNDFLIAASPTGKKYEAAKYKWQDGNIKIVNHVWLEECYSNWKVMDWNEKYYQSFGGEDRGVERLIGRIHINSSILRNWWDEVDDSMSEDESKESKDVKESKSKTISKKKSTKKVKEVKEDIKDEVKSSETGRDEINSSKSSKEKAKTTKNQKVATPPAANVQENNEPETKDDKSLTSPQTSTSTPGKTSDKENSPLRGGRSAAKKAAAKLHSDMADLNNYQQMKKNPNKMKHYLDELQGESSTPSKKSKVKSKAAPLMIALTTGCEQDLDLTPTKVSTLAELGITILNDFSEMHPVDTLVAPRIMRTEKFLKCLSQVNQIIHPSYISGILKKLDSPTSSTDLTTSESLSKEFKIEDYTLDKILGVKAINQELGFSATSSVNGLNKLLTSSLKGKVFQNMKFNLSTNLNGGTAVITKILEAHGCSETMVVKNINPNAKNVLLWTDVAENEQIYIAHKVKDAKAILNFKRSFPKGVVLDWDWCVKSIFKMKKEEYKKYKL